MSSKVAHLEYENSDVNIKAIRKIPKIDTPGIVLPQLEEGKEYSMLFWIAEELFKHGLAEYTDLSINNIEWTQIHFKERINPAGPPISLLDNFYERAYQTFIQAKRKVEPSTLTRMKARYREIIESRISRLVRIATSGTGSLASPLHKAEGILYDGLHVIIQDWRQKMRSIGD
jgi:hypothetical protein